MPDPINIFWFRRDLRLADNRALYHALMGNLQVLPIFIFDTKILNGLDGDDKRVPFIYECVADINKTLNNFNSSLHVFHDTPEHVFETLLADYNVETVFTNDDYEPYARDRDSSIESLLKQRNTAFKKFKDHVIFEKDEISKDNEEPYTVFTPYSKKWLQKIDDQSFKRYPSEKHLDKLVKKSKDFPSLESIGFEKQPKNFYPSKDLESELLKRYAEERNFPGLNSTSRIGIHLRFGTISIRQIAVTASKISATFLNELVWREFYQMILWHFPAVVNNCFKPAYENLKWRNNEVEFDRWCIGETGYPIVDAGMRELNETGFMHNRVRMITASFLCKHLLIDWRWGEAYFASKLLDFELASNNGGWQWTAGCGCDAAPYFRIFNPELQTKKFDPHLTYVKKWVPEFQEFTYPTPVVEHEYARKRCIEVYSKALNS